MGDLRRITHKTFTQIGGSLSRGSICSSRFSTEYSDDFSCISFMTADPSIQPSETDIIDAVSAVRLSGPPLGIPKLYAKIKVDHPTWSLSETRFRKILKLADAPARPSWGSAIKTGRDPSIDVAALAPKIRVREFSGNRGKGLIAHERIQRGELVWQEEPWVVVPHMCVKSAKQLY